MGTLVVLSLLSGAPLAAQSTPPLPKLPLDTYEAGLREPITRAYRSAETKPQDPDLNGALGMLLYANEQYQLAATCFERAHALGPGDARWSYYLGRVEIYLARADRAAASLRESLRLRPGYLPARLMLAKALLDAGQLDESRALYQALVDEQPETAEAHYGLGRIAVARGELEPAAERFRKACELFPDFGAAHYALARAYRDLGDPERAQAQLVLYQKDKVGWPAVPDPLLAAVLELKTGANARLRRGIQLAEAGELQAAIAEHEAALAADPKLVKAHVNLIRLYGVQGQPEQAAQHYRAAVAVDAGRAEAHYNYGVLLVGQGKPAEATRTFATVVELDPSHAEAQNNYASLLMTAGRLDEAALHYQAAIASKPDYRAARFDLARILVQQQKLKEAIEQLRQTLTPEDDDTPRYTYALGAALARAGNRAQAVQYMQDARDAAAARGQVVLVASIDRDLRALEQARAPR